MFWQSEKSDCRVVFNPKHDRAGCHRKGPIKYQHCLTEHLVTIYQIWFLVVTIFCSMLNVYFQFNSQEYADEISWDSVEYTCIWRKGLWQVLIVIFESLTGLLKPKSWKFLTLVSAVNDDVFLCPVLYTINIFSSNI